jgi:hypothetical protein
MNETVMDRRFALKDRRSNRWAKFGFAKRSSGFYGYSALIIAAVGGWLLRDYELINPETGLGYWLGIVGGTLMLFLLMYPLRKRFRILHVLGSTRNWFRLHMIFGLVGPLLILYHSNFHLGSFNSQVAFYCMLLVAISGVVGRHFYARIHNGLYGRKTSLGELQRELATSRENGKGLASIMPGVAHRLDELASELQGCKITQSLGIRRSLKWAASRHLIHFKLWLTARRELALAASRSAAIQRDQKRLRKVTYKYIRNYTNLMGRVAQFSFYERLFALWHVFHLPFFFMLIISALVHVLAVHMY